MDYDRLFSPLVINSCTLKNRIVFGPHRTNFAAHHVPSDEHLRYYARRARGGAGLIVVEGGVVHPLDYPYERAIFAWAKGAGEGYARIAAAVHRYDCPVVAQLTHCGGQADGSLSRREVWAPSPVPDVASGEIPKVMEEEDIAAVIDGFVTAAQRLYRSGLDGVEINAGQQALLRQFLSPLTNFRADAWGGSLENRARLCREVLRGVRRATGPAFVVGLRLCADEYAPWGGLTPEDGREIARYLCRDGLVDYLSVEVGGIYSRQMTAASMRHPEDYAVPPARLIAPGVPVGATGSIVSPGLAARLVEEGIDLVEMTRALIADPDLPEKVRGGRAHRPCVLCNQDCYVSSPMNPPLACAVNPGGEEGPPPTGRPKKVVVAGGGPAGLAAAAAAAGRGHTVVLYEKRDRPGGRLYLAAQTPGCGRFHDIIDYLYQKGRERGVVYQFGAPVGADFVAGQKPDAVIVAAGSVPAPLPFAVDEGAAVVRPEAILEGEAPAGGTVAVVDYEGAWPAVGVALFLAERGRKVRIISPELFVSPELAGNGEFVFWYQRASMLGIEFLPQTEVVRVGASSLEAVDRFSGRVLCVGPFDTVVAALPACPAQDLGLALGGMGVPVWPAGDCVAPRGLGAAIREGAGAAAAI